MPIYQSNENPVPIHSNLAIQNQSRTNLSTICQFISNPRPIRCRSANPLPICQSNAIDSPTRQSNANPLPTSQFNVNPRPICPATNLMPIQFQSSANIPANPSPIRQSNANPSPTHHRSTEPLSLPDQPTNLSPIYDKSTSPRPTHRGDQSRITDNPTQPYKQTTLKSFPLALDWQRSCQYQTNPSHKPPLR